jgi:antitoxin ParD1/3/4
LSFSALAKPGMMSDLDSIGQQLVDEEVASGHYASASEVIREGLRLLIEDRRWRAEVRQKIAEGVAQAKAGLMVDGDEAFGRLRKRVDGHRTKGA